MSKRATKEYFSLKSDLAYEEEEQRCVKDIFSLFFQAKRAWYVFCYFDPVSGKRKELPR
jgi:hypothetical protein